jgi:signal peptidase II
MGRHAAGRRVTPAGWLWGPASRVGLWTALIVLILDQATKLWLLFVYRLGERGLVTVTPFFDLVLTWNYGISYGLFQQHTDFGRWLLLAVTVGASVLLWLWLARTGGTLAALAIGLILGGAVGNGIDRFAYGAVADFALFHVTTDTWDFRWYVFNIADVAIVAGVVGLLYDSVRGDRAAKAP